MGKTIKDMKYKHPRGDLISPAKHHKMKKDYNRKREKNWRNFIDDDFDLDIDHKGDSNNDQGRTN